MERYYRRPGIELLIIGVVVLFLSCVIMNERWRVSELSREIELAKAKLLEYEATSASKAKEVNQYPAESKIDYSMKLIHELIDRNKELLQEKLESEMSAQRELQQNNFQKEMNELKSSLVSEYFSKLESLFSKVDDASIKTSQPATKNGAGSFEKIDYTNFEDHTNHQGFEDPDWKPARSFKPQFIAENWIIITSVNPPTDSIRKLSSLEGWQVLVVGDKKTDPNWFFPGCIFLGVKDQLRLPYRIVKYLPYASYTRKNIGYLYAIEHGAKLILDTDDDNEPFTDTIKVIPFDSALRALVREDYDDDRLLSHVVNPYNYFGRPDIWPRGYPLQAINISETQTTINPKGEILVPYIQQALADLDPDVDAIFRLSRFEAITHVKFDKKEPVLIGKNHLTPFNSQNTIFHYNAFWGLVLPTTVTFRVTDIWRGYWTQRMLWDIGGALMFLEPTVNQIRNAHNYLKDFYDEIPMYLQTDDYIKLLLEFEKPKPGDKLFSRILKLANKIEQAGLWKHHDVVVLEAWLLDLLDAGYKPPKLTNL